jgi:hypothetical protein
MFEYLSSPITSGQQEDLPRSTTLGCKLSRNYGSLLQPQPPSRFNWIRHKSSIGGLWSIVSNSDAANTPLSRIVKPRCLVGSRVISGLTTRS